MRSSVFILMVLSLFFLSAPIFGQEQKSTSGFQAKKNKQLTISEKSTASSSRNSFKKVDQRMTASQKLIHQRALARAEQRLRRINTRKAMGISLSRPNVSNSLFPSTVEVMQPAPNFFYNPSRFFYGYWYGP
ncbi:hypothetical protein [Gimesia aquarii]|uniref:Uncharacterized protein n=1 Tax=Gimesia aquarii TaxID=2527964 RepID=A0A517WVN1_9PLAN|nr:hypothetical protein [Gimesia aquarii]QDU09316.1 hypothetical protein V202x_26890 [Gimesia aquarii]